MSKGLFVTGTDTDVGKTVLCALLCASLSARYWKPIQTGASEGTDRERVIRWAASNANFAHPEAYVSDEPVSPHLARWESGRRISLENMSLPRGDVGRPLIVEGAGGVMVPVNSSELMTGLMRRLGLPVIVASRTALGAINHTLLSLLALRQAGLTVRGVVLIGPENIELVETPRPHEPGEP